MIPADHKDFDRLEEVRRFEGEPSAFWPRLLEAFCGLVGGSMAVALQAPTRGPAPWKPTARHPASGRLAFPIALEGAPFDDLVEKALLDSVAVLPGAGAFDGALLLVALETGNPTQHTLALVRTPYADNETLAEASQSLRLARDTPLLYERERSLLQARRDIDQAVQALDLLSQLNEHRRFHPLALNFCNEVARHYGASRVALGWLEKPYVRMKSISHMDRFEKKMDVVQHLEKVMEECLDQDEEISFPVPSGETFVARDHAAFAEREGSGHILSIPLRNEGEVRGILTLERADRPFDATEVRGLRVLLDQAAPRIEDRLHADRWFGARLARASRRGLAKVFGFEHTWAKVIGLVCAVALGVLIFGKAMYRVEGTFLLRSDVLTFLPAPYDGYIETVDARVGDFVSGGETLVTLDTSDLLLQEGAAIAEIQRFLSDAEAAEANRDLATMRAARAQVEQARANLDLIRFRLDRANLQAPYDGVLVEGDLRDRIGSPVTSGDILMRLTRLEDLYIEIEVPERDIHDILESTEGEIAFASRPDQKFAFTVERIEPMAIEGADGNVFMVRARVDGEIAEWWRPGMTGVAKIDVEDRTFFTIFTHRLVDFLRLKLWW